MRKFEIFFNKIATLRSELRGENGFVAKAIIGASVGNNRTLTVNQTIQYLQVTRKVKLAKQLAAVKAVLQEEISCHRSENNNRTDAVDLNEFVTTMRQVVMNERRYRKEIGNILKVV